MTLPYGRAFLMVSPLLAVLVCRMASQAIYHPSRFPEGQWEMQGPLNAADVWLRTKDGVSLHAWWMERPASGMAALFLHGNAGNLTHRAGKYRELDAAGCSVLAVDYRGYGKSEGRPGEAGLYLDGEAAYEYLVKRGYRAEQIVLYGESLGTAVAVDLAAKRPCLGVILEAPFTSAKDVAGLLLPVAGRALVESFDSRGKIAGVRAPLLVMHGSRDRVIPPRMGEALFAAAREPKSFWRVAGAGHNDILQVAGTAYGERLRAFLGGLPDRDGRRP